MKSKIKPRSASESGKEFPYGSPKTCYIEIHGDGSVTQGMDRESYERARSGESRIFAVWPGNWRSDLFSVDDLDEWAKDVGIINDRERTGLSEHIHKINWREVHGPLNNVYADIEVHLKCGCEIKSIDTFADQMQEQRGWNIARTSGYSGCGGNRGYVIRARRKSLS